MDLGKEQRYSSGRWCKKGPLAQPHASVLLSWLMWLLWTQIEDPGFGIGQKLKGCVGAMRWKRWGEGSGNRVQKERIQ